MKQIEIICTIPGVFYTKASPDSENYKIPGDVVNKNDIIYLIEVMKIFNYIESEVEGRFVSYEVENEEMVMPGQVVAIIEIEQS